MKKIASILFIVSALFLASCEGPVGPVGPVGPPGEDAFIGTTFEFTDNFTAPEYKLVFNFFDNGLEPYESDVVLTYILWTNEDGLDFWRPLPQTTYFDSGAILQYNFDFTADIPNNRLIDMAVFLEGDIDLSTLPDDFTKNQTFRIVVVPSNFLSMTKIDGSDINAILSSPEIQMRSLDNIDLRSNLEIK